MQYVVKLIVISNEDPAFAGRIKDAITTSGGNVRENEVKNTAAADAQEQYVIFEIGNPRVLGDIVAAVEAIPRGAVMAVTDPQVLGDSQPGSRGNARDSDAGYPCPL